MSHSKQTNIFNNNKLTEKEEALQKLMFKNKESLKRDKNKKYIKSKRQKK